MTNKTEEILRRVDRYLSLLRYGYSDMEKLSRLKVLDDYYKSLDCVSTTESLCSSVICAEQLAKGDLVLPLKVKGVFLTEGRHKVKFYTVEELEKSTYNPVNDKFPLMLDHEDTKAGKIIGMVDKIEYDPDVRGIRWWGHINDETHARNVVDGAIREVSATIYSVTEYDNELGVVGKDLTYKELSLVIEGAATGNYIEVDE